MVDKVVSKDAKTLSEPTDAGNIYPDKLVDMKEYAKSKGYDLDEYVEITRRDKMVEYLDSKLNSKV
jgi:hypothetical protein